MSKELIDRLKSYIPSGDWHNSQYANDLADAVAILEAKAAPVGELREAFEAWFNKEKLPSVSYGNPNILKKPLWPAFQAGAAYQRQIGVEMPSAEKLADLFIGCPLPKTVRVDPCAIDPDYPHRFGTNLLTWREAKTMFEEMFARLNGAGSHE